MGSRISSSEKLAAHGGQSPFRFVLFWPRTSASHARQPSLLCHSFGHSNLNVPEGLLGAWQMKSLAPRQKFGCTRPPYPTPPSPSASSCPVPSAASAAATASSGQQHSYDRACALSVLLLVVDLSGVQPSRQLQGPKSLGRYGRAPHEVLQESYSCP